MPDHALIHHADTYDAHHDPGSWDHGHRGHDGGSEYASGHDVIADPGAHLGLDDRLALPDPLQHLAAYQFPAFTFAHHGGVLIDTDGDGVADHTAWGTPVELIEPYVRSDGTLVREHYRTIADGLRYNNLG